MPSSLKISKNTRLYCMTIWRWIYELSERDSSKCEKGTFFLGVVLKGWTQIWVSTCPGQHVTWENQEYMKIEGRWLHNENPYSPVKMVTVQLYRVLVLWSILPLQKWSHFQQGVHFYLGLNSSAHNVQHIIHRNIHQVTECYIYLTHPTLFLVQYYFLNQKYLSIRSPRAKMPRMQHKD